MQIRTLILLLAVLCSLAFVILNWGAISTPVNVSLGFTTVLAAPGLILLGLLVVISVLFAGFAGNLQRTLLLESRQHSKELEAQRILADNAEASRFTELRRFLEVVLRQSSERDAALQAALLGRLDAHELALRAALEESGNGMAAQIGELEDRLERLGYRGNPEGLH